MNVLVLLIGDVAAAYVWALLWIACLTGYVVMFRDLAHMDATETRLKVAYLLGLCLLVLASTTTGEALMYGGCSEDVLRPLYGDWWTWAAWLKGC